MEPQSLCWLSFILNDTLYKFTMKDGMPCHRICCRCETFFFFRRFEKGFFVSLEAGLAAVR